MRLFGRKRSKDDLEERCPQCGEPVPEGALECVMCGADLRPYRGALRDEEGSSRQADTPSA
jgi:hypothetical protein